jgi:hypothetical protein
MTTALQQPQVPPLSHRGRRVKLSINLRLPLRIRWVPARKIEVLVRLVVVDRVERVSHGAAVQVTPRHVEIFFQVEVVRQAAFEAFEARLVEYQ